MSRLPLSSRKNLKANAEKKEEFLKRIEAVTDKSELVYEFDEIKIDAELNTSGYQNRIGDVVLDSRLEALAEFMEDFCSDGANKSNLLEKWTSNKIIYRFEDKSKAKQNTKIEEGDFIMYSKPGDVNTNMHTLGQDLEQKLNLNSSAADKDESKDNDVSADESNDDSEAKSDSEDESNDDSDDDGPKEIKATLPNGKTYIIQNGVPFEVTTGGFTGLKPKVKFLTPTLKQWFNPEDVSEYDLDDKLQGIVDQIYKMTGKSSDDTQNGPGENLFEKRVKKPCGPCKGTAVWKGKKCTFCKGKGTN